MIIGITGGTGCGKTTALQAMDELGGVIIDCDQVYHRLLQTDTALLDAIENRFPGTVENGRLNRKALSSIVFSDAQALKDLNFITHSAVKKQVMGILQSGVCLAAIDAVELFDGGLADLCDVTVAVTAPEAVRIPRLMARDGLTRELAVQRIRAQKPERYYRAHCDYILENTADAVEFHGKCLDFFRKLATIKETPIKEDPHDN